MAYQSDIDRIVSLLTSMGLNAYQASALSHLLLLGETKATVLSEVSGIPTARIYDVLSDLAKMGLLTKKSGRPSLYKPRPPEDIISLLMAVQRDNLRKSLILLENKAEEFIEAGSRIYLKGVKGPQNVPLLRIVSVGNVSLKETRSLYDAAVKEILILSKAMEYFPEVSENLEAAKNRMVSIKIILMNPRLMELEDRVKQARIVDATKRTLGEAVTLRFSDEVPIRGSIVDQEIGGRAIFLVEDPGVPFFLREAAITSHSSVVKGLALMFNLLWEHRSQKLDYKFVQNQEKLN